MGVLPFVSDGAYAGIGKFLWPNPCGLPTNAASTQTMTAATDAVASRFSCPKTGNIDRVYWRTGTVTTGCTLDVRLETVGSDGYPSGTLAGTNANASRVVANTDDNVWFETTLTTPLAVTEGQMLYMVFRVASGTPSLNLARPNGIDLIPDGAMSIRYASSVWGTKQVPLHAGVRYDDGTYPDVWMHSAFVGSPSATNVTASTNPDEYGAKLTLPFGAQILGIWCRGASTASSSTFNANLYNSDGSVLLAQQSFEAYNVRAAGIHPWHFQGEYNAAPGTYIAAIEVTGAVNVSFARQTSSYFSTAALGDWGTYVRRQNAGAWSETTTEFPYFGLILGGLNIPDRVTGSA